MAYKESLAALSDPMRRTILEQIVAAPRSVGEIADKLPISQPAVSQHLKVLKEAGLVSDRQDGTRRIYAIDPKGLGVLRAWLDQFWSEALKAFQVEVEAGGEDDG